MDKEPYPRVVLHLRGGLLEELETSIPIDVVCIDHDDTADEEDYAQFEYEGRQEPGTVWISHPEKEGDIRGQVAPKYVESIYKQAICHLKKNGFPY